MKRLLTFLVVAVVMVTCLAVTASAKTDVWDGSIASGFASGTGTETDPYIIDSAEQLAYLADSSFNGSHYEGMYFKLTSDIDLNNIFWTAIGCNYPFKGNFDGDGHEVSGLYINSYDDYQGLFGYTSYATISNVGVVDSYISGGGYVGAIVGFNSHTAIIKCYNESHVSGESYVGGIVGYSNHGDIYTSYNTGDISGENYDIGGIVGSNSYGNVYNSYNVGNVSGYSEIGGIFGYSSGGGVTKSYNAGLINGLDSGAIIGWCSSGSITGCYYLAGSATYAVGAGSGYATELTASQMRDKASFSNFDFDTVWTISSKNNNGYPYLQGGKSAITITAPTKLEYHAGDIVDFAGLTVVEELPDGQINEITDYVLDCDFDVKGKLTAGTHTVTVTYGEESYSFDITVAGHDYKTVVTKATTTKDGKSEEKCSACGDVKSTKTIYKITSIAFKKSSSTYDGSTKKPSVVVKDSKGNTISSSNYTVSYPSGMKSAGTYSVKVTLGGNYSGTKTLTYKINPISISTCKVSFKKAYSTYDGSTKKPSVVVTNANGSALSTASYSVKYPSGMKNAGTYSVKVTLGGNYTGTKTLTYKINPIDISTCKVSFKKAVSIYDGKTKKPSVSVVNANGSTLSTASYSVKYPSGMKNVGTYSVKVTLKGNYTGTKTLTYKITPTEKTSASVLVGDTIKIGAKSNTKITYSTSNSKIATVSSKGTIKGVAAGTATITVKSNGVSQKIKVTVKKPSVNITTSATGLFIGQTMTMKASTYPSGAKVTWSVSNKSIAKITSAGKITGLDEGTVTVTARITYNGKTYKDTHKLKVTVDYPDVEVFMSRQSDYTDFYVVILTNNENSSIKVLDRGYVYVGGESEDIYALYTGGNSYLSSVTVSGDSMETIGIVLDDDLLFLSSNMVWLDIYVEYRGELFLLECRTDYSYLDGCFRITWYYD